MKTILFQGDSITDAVRFRESEHYMGSGYATMTAGKIGADYPGQYRCLNRGIGGDRSIDLYARIKKDIINLAPDILTILIGVNDTWHELAHNDGVDIERYEDILNMLICDVKIALPQIRIVLLEPFVLHGSDTDVYYDAFTRDVAMRQQVCKKLAEHHQLIYVPLQKSLNDFAEKTSCEQVVIDGVHPTATGHELISRGLYRALKAIL